MKSQVAAMAGFAAAVFASSCAGIGNSCGATRIAKYPGDRRGAFILMHDDGCRSQLDNAVPELIKRGLPGTFYINPEVQWYKECESEWLAVFVGNPGVIVPGNHTFRHGVVESVSDLDAAIGDCDAYLRSKAGVPQGELVSFGWPGGCGYEKAITPEAEAPYLKKYRSARRPEPQDRQIAGRACASAADAVSLVDRAVASGTVEGVFFHGVGGDWFNFPAAEYVKLLDVLAARSAEVWTAAPADVFKYQTETAFAAIRNEACGDGSLSFELECGTNPDVFDFPLTLISRVPDSWHRVEVLQQGFSPAVFSADGQKTVYTVFPATGRIELRRAE